MRDNTLNTPDLQWISGIVILLPGNAHLPSWATIYDLHSSYNEAVLKHETSNWRSQVWFVSTSHLKNRFPLLRGGRISRRSNLSGYYFDKQIEGLLRFARNVGVQ